MQRFGRCVLALWLAVLYVVVPIAPENGPSAQAQPPDDQLGESILFVTLFPQLRNLPPPNWFEPGVRVSYNTITANFQGGGAGSAITQYDVVGLDAGWAIASSQMWMDGGGGGLIPMGAQPRVGLFAVGEFWINPQVLANAENVAAGIPNLNVTRSVKTYMGQNFQVVRFQSQSMTQTGTATSVWEFDASGGLLMFHSQELEGLSAYQVEVIHFRTQRQLPTQGATAPNWVRPGAQMDFTGQQTQFVAGAGSFTQPYAVSNQIVGATSRWSLQTQNNFLSNSLSGSTVTATGIGQIFGGIWLPQEALNRIVPQETLIDEDPVTGVQLTVGRTQQNEIFLREVNQVYETILFYDPVLGALNGFFNEIRTMNSTTRNELQRTGGSDLQQLNNLPPLAGAPQTPNTPIDTDAGTDQVVEIDLPSTRLRLELPGDFVAEPVNTSVSVVLGPPVPPAGATFVGDPFALLVTSQQTGAPLATFERPVTLRVQLPGTSGAAVGIGATDDGSEPVMYYRTEVGWEPLDSVYDADNQTVSASHNRSGIYAVLQADLLEADPEDEEPEDEEPEDEEPEDEEPEEVDEFRTFLPAIQR